jgi:hypothetical protein
MTNFVAQRDQSPLHFPTRESGADEKQRQAVRERAGALVKEARGGKDFAQLAKRESDDPAPPKAAIWVG